MSPNVSNTAVFIIQLLFHSGTFSYRRCQRVWRCCAVQYFWLISYFNPELRTRAALAYEYQHICFITNCVTAETLVSFSPARTLGVPDAIWCKIPAMARC